MSFAHPHAQLLRVVGAVVLLGMVGAGSAKTHSEPHYPTQGAISHTLPTAVGSFSCQSAPAGSQNDYLTCAYAGPNAVTMTFYLFVPANYDASKRYPLTLILHGSGERAISGHTATQNRAALLNNEYVAVWGPGSPAGGPSVQETYPSFVVAPQIAATDSWVGAPLAHGSYGLPKDPTDDLATAMVIVQLVQQRYADRLYATGISMGAFGVWEAIERWPGYFAAAVPVAGAGSPALASELKATPVWAFHGAADISVPSSGSKDMVLAIRAAGGHACYTLYPNAPHVIWNTVYGLAGNATNPLYPWLFAQNNADARSTTSSC